ncbi:MAG TPA: DinB family protein [Burkholderiaceae bacterium]|nr:DinB family protein [Burkholderiaceae bacterium]
MSTLLQQLRTLARGNRLANHRLHGACSQLTNDEFRAPRTSFFPSLWATLNHILIVDWYYIAALYGEADMRRAFDSETPYDNMRELAAAQDKSDQRLIDWCDAADDAALDVVVEMDRDTFVQRDLARHVLMHLLTHQIHHRGQAHAMLSGTTIKPPQLDEFVMPSETHYRVADLAVLGWTEADLFGDR